MIPAALRERQICQVSISLTDFASAGELCYQRDSPVQPGAGITGSGQPYFVYMMCPVFSSEPPPSSP